MKKILIISIVLLILMMLISINCFAIDPASITTTAVDDFDANGKIVIRALQVIGMIVSVAVFAYVGIRILLAAPSEKANIKGMLVPYLVGAIVIFSAVNLAQLIYNLASIM